MLLKIVTVISKGVLLTAVYTVLAMYQSFGHTSHTYKSSHCSA